MKISVIIPVYNGAAHVPHAVRSVLDQTALPLEIIIVDDGSTDGSDEVIRQAAIASPVPIVIISQANSGQSAARNAAAAIASGELLAFLDQDDLWRPTHLERMAAHFDAEDSADLGWLYGDFDEIDGEGRLVTRNFMEAVGVAGPRMTVVSIIHRDCMIIPSASLIRASAYAQVGGFDPQLQGYEDDDLFYRMFRAGWLSTFMPESLTSFRVHANSSSTRASFRESRVRFFLKVATDLPDDARMRRFYITDVLRPRLLSSTLSEYSLAIALRRNDEARAIVASVEVLVAGPRPSARKRFGLALLRRPALAGFLLRVERRLPRFVRLPIPGALSLRR